jgi:hypothetical protein
MTTALPSDADLVDAAATTYSGKIPFIDDLDSAIRVFLTTRPDGSTIVAIEGTHDVLGWALDFCALSIRQQGGIVHPSLGFIHAGFNLAADRVFNRIVAELEKRGTPFAMAGHSLGAALALLIGARLKVDAGLPPTKIGAFAPPRVGGDTFVNLVKTIPLCAYWYGDDPVPRVPFHWVPLWPYDGVPLAHVGPDATLDDNWLDNLHVKVRDHHIDNYVAAIHGTATVPVTLRPGDG